MLTLQTELILSLFLTATGLRFLPAQGDSEEAMSSGDSLTGSSELELGEIPKRFRAGFSSSQRPRLSVPRLWSTFVGLQSKRADASADDLPSLGLRFLIKQHPAGGSWRNRGLDVAQEGSGRRVPFPALPAWGERVPSPALSGSDRKRAGSIQIHKMNSYGVWGTVPADTRFRAGPQKRRPPSKKNTPRFRPSVDDASKRREEALARDWFGRSNPTDKPSIAAALSRNYTNDDGKSRQRSAEEAWRRLIDKGRGVTEEIVLPLSEREATGSSCRAVPFTQSISHLNCKTFNIQNRLCFGHCSSFFIPGTEQRLYRSCSRCFPSQLKKIVVSLECEGVLVVSRNITLIEECKCDLETEQLLKN
ncbi:cerberus-like [Stegostoma tigrinum]|uniref:cerberus-like n=1 Tax=Stegostoma tigrinum TaxID=3053191 RepID=UPI00202B83F9|nr:cerberus-like [Stegostoma tigrinum]